MQVPFLRGFPPERIRDISICHSSNTSIFFSQQLYFCGKEYWSSTRLGPTVTVSLPLSPSSSSPLIIIITINRHHIYVFWGRPGIEVHSCRRAEPLLKDILSSQKLSQIYFFKKWLWNKIIHILVLVWLLYICSSTFDISMVVLKKTWKPAISIPEFLPWLMLHLMWVWFSWYCSQGSHIIRKALFFWKLQ